MSTFIVAAVLFSGVGYACYRMFRHRDGGCHGDCGSCHSCPHGEPHQK